MKPEEFYQSLKSDMVETKFIDNIDKGSPIERATQFLRQHPEIALRLYDINNENIEERDKRFFQALAEYILPKTRCDNAEDIVSDFKNTHFRCEIQHIASQQAVNSLTGTDLENALRQIVANETPEFVIKQEFLSLEQEIFGKIISDKIIERFKERMKALNAYDQSWSKQLNTILNDKINEYILPNKETFYLQVAAEIRSLWCNGWSDGAQIKQGFFRALESKKISPTNEDGSNNPLGNWQGNMRFCNALFLYHNKSPKTKAYDHSAEKLEKFISRPFAAGIDIHGYLFEYRHDKIVIIFFEFIIEEYMNKSFLSLKDNRDSPDLLVNVLLKALGDETYTPLSSGELSSFTKSISEIFKKYIMNSPDHPVKLLYNVISLIGKFNNLDPLNLFENEKVAEKFISIIINNFSNTGKQTDEMTFILNSPIFKHVMNERKKFNGLELLKKCLAEKNAGTDHLLAMLYLPDSSKNVLGQQLNIKEKESIAIELK